MLVSWKHGGVSDLVFGMEQLEQEKHEARRANLAKGRAVLAAKGREAMMANLAKAPATARKAGIAST